MPKYRAKTDLYVADVLIKPGQTFESNDVPGKNWEPMDIGARSKVKATFGATAAADEPEAAPAKAKKPGRWSTAKAGKTAADTVDYEPKPEAGTDKPS